MRTPLCLAFALFVVPVAAQGKTAAKLAAPNFFPPDYTNVAFADLAALRATGIWEDIEASVLGAVLKSMEKENGWPLANLDRVTGVVRVRPEDREGGMASFNPEQVIVLEGSAPVPVAPSTQQNGQSDEIGGYPVRLRRMGGEMVFVNPTPELQVWGSRTLVEPVLTGTPWNGKPAADLMSLLSGKGDNLAYFVMDVQIRLFRDRFLGSTLGEVPWPADDMPAFLMLRVRAIGDKDDPHVQVEAVLRHLKADDGIAKSESAAKVWLAKLVADPYFANVRAKLSKVELKRQAGDLIATIDLGRSREAVSTLTALALPILRPAAMAEKVEEARVPPPAGKGEKK